jgi:hypothetical protein
MHKEEHSKARIFSKKLFFSYLKKNIVITGVAGYYFIGLILYIFAEIDILIPCIWKSIFDIRCPGCGLTRAFMFLLQLDFTAAWDSNPLIFVVFPALSYYIINDIVKFVKKNK